MLSLFDLCNLDITYDNKNNSFYFGDDVVTGAARTVNLPNLLPILLNKSLCYPETVYSEHNSVRHIEDEDLVNANISFDLISIPSGLLGIEYIKSHIYYSPEDTQQGSYSMIIEVVYGELTIIMQKNLPPQDEFDFEKNVERGIIIKMNKGEKCAIPKGYYYTFINTTDHPVIFFRASKFNQHINYDQLRHEGGLAYYCIRKNAREEIVKNPLYRDIPEIEHLKPGKFISELKEDLDHHLYPLLRKKTGFISQLLCSYC